MKKITNGDCRGALPDLKKVVELAPDHENGLFTLAHCYEALGRLASAWSYNEHAAAKNGQLKERARELARGLVPRLAHLLIVVSEPVQRLPEIKVSLDGDEVPLGPGGVDVPVDKGSHVVVATAKGKQRWETKVEVEADGSAQSVAIVALQDEPPPPRRWAPIDVEGRLGAAFRLRAQPGPGFTGRVAALVAPVAWFAAGVAYDHTIFQEDADQPTTSTSTETTRHLNTLWSTFRLRAPELGRVQLSLLLGPGVSWQKASTAVTNLTPGNFMASTCSESDGPNLALHGGLGGDVRLGLGLSFVIDTAVDYAHLSGNPACALGPAPSALLMIGAHAGFAYHFGR